MSLKAEQNAAITSCPLQILNGFFEKAPCRSLYEILGPKGHVQGVIGLGGRDKGRILFCCQYNSSTAACKCQEKWQAQHISHVRSHNIMKERGCLQTQLETVKIVHICRKDCLGTALHNKHPRPSCKQYILLQIFLAHKPVRSL